MLKSCEVSTSGVYLYCCNEAITKNKIMTFTKENQKENKITNTTTQTVKHVMYSNNSVNITGINGIHTVWLTQGHRVSQKADGLNLVDSVKFANELIKSI